MSGLPVIPGVNSLLVISKKLMSPDCPTLQAAAGLLLRKLFVSKHNSVAEWTHKKSTMGSFYVSQQVIQCELDAEQQICLNANNEARRDT